MTVSRLDVATQHVRLILTAAAGGDVPPSIDEHASGLAESLLAAVDAVDKTRAAVRAVRRIHRPYDADPGFCDVCSSSWPCATSRILDGAQ
jgi:hypothetical protein